MRPAPRAGEMRIATDRAAAQLLSIPDQPAAARHPTRSHEPALIRLLPVATSRSGTVVSSVSPGQWKVTTGIRLCVRVRRSPGIRRDLPAAFRDHGHEHWGRAPGQGEDRALDAVPCALSVQTEAGVDVPKTRQAARLRQRCLHQQDATQERLS